MIDYFKETEKLLTELPMLKLSIQNLQDRKMSLAGTISAPQPPRTSKPSRAALSKSEEMWIDYQQISKQIGYTRIIVEHVERVLQQLDSEERVVLEFWYIDHLPKEQILEEMHYESLTTVYGIKNRAVRRFALLYYGGRLSD